MEVQDLSLTEFLSLDSFSVELSFLPEQIVADLTGPDNGFESGSGLNQV